MPDLTSLMQGFLQFRQPHEKQIMTDAMLPEALAARANPRTIRHACERVALFFEFAGSGVVSSFVPKLSLTMMFYLLWLAAPAFADTTFLIFPLDNQTRQPALSWIGEGFALALSEECQVPGIDTIGWEERVGFVEASDLPPHTPLSRASMIRVSQRVGADRMIFGSYSGTEDNLRIELRVLDVRSLKLGGPMVANGPASALPQLENELAWLMVSEDGRNGALTRESFRSRIRAVPNNVYAEFVNCLTVGDKADRARMLLKAIDAYRDFPQAAFLLGSYYFEAGDCTRAIQYLKLALGAAQSFLDAQFMLGNCYLKQESLVDAIQAYNAVLARHQALEVLNNIGVAYLRRSDYALAAQCLITARKLAKTDFTVGLNLAILRQLQGDQEAARLVLDELVKAHQEQGMLQYLYAMALIARGEAEKGAVALEQAQRLGIDPDAMKGQDLRKWALIFPSWMRHPTMLAIETRKEK